MNTEIRSTTTIKLLGMTITKRVFVNDSEVIQFFDFTYEGIQCMISTYGMNFNRKDGGHRTYYAGFGETWNHWAYMILTEKQLAIVDPDFIIELNRPSEEDELWRSYYAGACFKQSEVTYTQKRDDGMWQVGIDYQHGWNNADNTDLFTVMSELMMEVDLMLTKHGAEFDKK